MVPTSLKVLGILGIILSALIILSTPCSLFMMYHPMTPNPVMDQLNQDRTYVGYMLGAGTLSFCIGILLLASSIGCLKAKPWARTGMNTYAVAYSLTTIAGMIFNFVFLMPKMKEAMAAAPGPATLPPATFELLQMIGAIVGLLIAAAIVTTILIIVNRKIAVDAFHGIFPADPNFPADPGMPPPPLP